MATPPMVPAGWYADPARRHEYRYWDGVNWTAGVADAGITAHDPLEAPPSPVLGPAPVQTQPAQPTAAQAQPAQPTAAQAQPTQQSEAAQQTPAAPVEDPPAWQAAATQQPVSAQPVDDPPIWHSPGTPQAAPAQPAEDPPIWQGHVTPQAGSAGAAEQIPPIWAAASQVPPTAPQPAPYQTGPLPQVPMYQTGPQPQVPMQGGPGQAMPTPPLPGELWPGATIAAPAPAPPQRRRRGLLFAGIAGAVVLALIIGLVVWAPWKVPPLLRPTGLKAGAVTVSSIGLQWANPPSGPDPDKYLILYNGKVIGTVPGTVTKYQTSGLAPDTPYAYRVVAERDGQRSAQSAQILVHTAIPPVSAARWDGLWTVKIKIVKGRNTINGAKKWTETWLATPKCTTGPCTVRLSVAINGHNFKVNLTRSGADYKGSARTHVFPCGSGANSFPIKSTLDLKITVGTAQVESGAWKASSWKGTLVVHSPYTAKGNFYCPASSQTATLSSAGI